MKPYYQDKWVTIYHGDCQEILPKLNVKADLILTDPPYPNMEGRVAEYLQTPIDFLNNFKCRQLIFWLAKGDFPLNFVAIHIWYKKTGCQSEYERIFERNSTNGHWHVFSEYLINSSMAAKYTGDVFTGHYSQKPSKLINRLLLMGSKEHNIILDPFLGSGTTCCCSKKLNRYSIGIEVEEKYCEIAAKRCSQEVMELNI